MGTYTRPFSLRVDFLVSERAYQTPRCELASNVAIMSSVTFGGLVRAGLDSFKLTGSALNFGVHFELLCAEIAAQELRFNLWGSSVSYQTT